MGKDSQVANAKQDDMAHIRLAVRQLCAKYGEDYWLNMDRTSGYPAILSQNSLPLVFLACLYQRNTVVLDWA